MKSFKDLFIKSDEEPEEVKEQLAFPVSESKGPSSEAKQEANQYLSEIIDVYEKGLESINMPGYDFYDFYLAVKAAGAENESVYKMAFQMGKSMDKNITPQKLASDAEYYLSKLNEVYQTYSEKGAAKLSSLDAECRKEKEDLSGEASKIEAEIGALRKQIITLEQRLGETRSNLSRVDGKFHPQQDAIKQKLQANDQAMQISVQRLKSIRDGLLRYLK